MADENPRAANDEEMWRALALASAFVRHEVAGDREAARYLLDEVRETGLIEPVLFTLAAIVKNYGVEARGSTEALVMDLNAMAVNATLSAEQGDPM